MRALLLVTLSLAFAGVTLVATADEAAACTPPNCPGWGACHVTWERVYLSDPVGPVGHVDAPSGYECYY